MSVNELGTVLNSFYKVKNQLVWFDKVQKFGKCIINAQHIELKQREKSVKILIGKRENISWFIFKNFGRIFSFRNVILDGNI